MRDEPNQLSLRQKNNWEWAKRGAVMIGVAFALYFLGVFLAAQLSEKIIFFSKTSSFLMFVGAALVAWDVYVNRLSKRSK
jgi:hypothetical protein